MTCPHIDEYPAYAGVERESGDDKGLFLKEPIGDQLAKGENDLFFTVEWIKGRVLSLMRLLI